MKPLIAIHPQPIQLRHPGAPRPAGPSLAAQLCAHLQQHGACTAQQLSQATGIPGHRIGALLKDRIHRGRVQATKLPGGVNQYAPKAN